MFSFVSELLRPISVRASSRLLLGFRSSYRFRLAHLLFHLRGNARDERISFHVFYHDRTRPRHRSATDLNRRDKHRIATDPNVVTDPSLVFVLAVVIASDGSRPDVRVLADGRVTEVSQMTRFRARSERRLFELYKIPYLGLRLHLCIAAQVRHRSYSAVVSDLRIHDHAVVEDIHAVAEVRIRQPRAGTDRAAVADLAFPFDGHVRMDHHITSDLCPLADIDVFRIDECHTIVEHKACHGSPVQNSFEIGELNAIVHTLDFISVTVQKYRHVLAGLTHQSGDVGQVILALRIPGLDLSELIEELARVETVDAGVDLCDLPFVVARVTLFDDLLE